MWRGLSKSRSKPTPRWGYVSIARLADRRQVGSVMWKSPKLGTIHLYKGTYITVCGTTVDSLRDDRRPLAAHGLESNDSAVQGICLLARILAWFLARTQAKSFLPKYKGKKTRSYMSKINTLSLKVAMMSLNVHNGSHSPLGLKPVHTPCITCIHHVILGTHPSYPSELPSPTLA